MAAVKAVTTARATAERSQPPRVSLGKVIKTMKETRGMSVKCNETARGRARSEHHRVLST
ncbi:hypothetical protein [Streptomyces sp. NPDC048669]|uniref:hypothetical protein n=1 Tax=Streptomyces sp. NPDC048669 TaxID=3155267 RepID=UPI00342F6356